MYTKSSLGWSVSDLVGRARGCYPLMASRLHVFRAMSVDFFRWQVEIFGENVEDVFGNDKAEFIGDVVEFVLVLEQFLDRLDTDETLVFRRVDPLGVQNRRANDSSQIGHVHP